MAMPIATGMGRRARDRLYEQLTGADLFSTPATIEAPKAELVAKRGPSFKYTTALGDQKPQRDYRKGSVP